MDLALDSVLDTPATVRNFPSEDDLVQETSIWSWKADDVESVRLDTWIWVKKYGRSLEVGKHSHLFLLYAVQIFSRSRSGTLSLLITRVNESYGSGMYV